MRLSQYQAQQQQHHPGQVSLSCSLLAAAPRIQTMTTTRREVFFSLSLSLPDLQDAAMDGKYSSSSIDFAPHLSVIVVWLLLPLFDLTWKMDKMNPKSRIVEFEIKFVCWRWNWNWNSQADRHFDSCDGRLTKERQDPSIKVALRVGIASFFFSSAANYFHWRRTFSASDGINENVLSGRSFVSPTRKSSLHSFESFWVPLISGFVMQKKNFP